MKPFPQFKKLILSICLLLSAASFSFAQLSPSRFTPSYGEFFKQAWREKGPITAILATSDRLQRDTRIGLASSHYLRQDGRVHEDIFGLIPQKQPVKSFALESLSPSGEYRYISEDEDFIKYLIGNGYSSEAVCYLYGSNFAPSDSLDYYKAYSLYSAGALDRAAKEYSKILPESSYYEASLFFGSVCDTYLLDYDSASRRIQSYSGDQKELKAYELAGISLLKNDADSYQAYSKDFTYSSYLFSEGEKIFDEIYHSRFEEKRKSPLMAATLSALIPGLGKIYTGAYGEAISSFLLWGCSTALAIDNGLKNGAGDWRTIIFSSISSLLYLGNIYGSYISVGLYYDYLEDAQNSTILVNLHIPIRTVFK